MVFLSVVKDENDQWKILKIISNPINVRGNKTGNTYGDIRVLDLDVRISEGFWTQNDVYENTGEYMYYVETVTTFDPEKAEVTNTYKYERQPLDEISADLKNRVESKRDSLYFEGFEFQGNKFESNVNNRSNIQLVLLNAIVDESSFPSNLAWKSLSGELIEMDLSTFKLFAKALGDFTSSLFIKERQIKDAISAAGTYEELRAAASWDGEQL